MQWTYTRIDGKPVISDPVTKVVGGGPNPRVSQGQIEAMQNWKTP
jgi:hypothetical protein